MERKPLCDFFKSLRMPVLAWAKENNVRALVPGIYRHLQWEKGERDIKKARPMGQTQAIEMIRASGGRLSLNDLRPDKASEIRKIQDLETQNA